MCNYRLALMYQLEGIYIFLNLYIWSIALNFSISLDCKGPKNSRSFCFVISSGSCIYYFHHPVFHSVCILSNEYNDQFYRTFLYIPLVLKLETKWLIDSVFTSHNLHTGFDLFFYNVYLIVSCW